MPPLQLPRLDHDRAFGRRAGEQRFERGQEIAALRVDPDRPAAAEHRHRIGLVGQALGTAGERVAFDPDEAERVGVNADQLAHDGSRAFVGQSFVDPVHEEELARPKAGDRCSRLRLGC